MREDNPRVTRTKGYLKEALIELLKTMPFENITIKAICQKAAVNRSTFYAYYTCPRDLIEEIESDILSKLPDYNPGNPKPFIDSIIQFMGYIKETGDAFRILLSTTADTTFGEQVVAAVMDKYEDFATLQNQEERKMAFIFVVNGVVGIVREWIKSDFQLSVDRISRMIIDMAFGAVGLNPSDAYNS